MLKANNEVSWKISYMTSLLLNTLLLQLYIAITKEKPGTNMQTMSLFYDEKVNR